MWRFAPRILRTASKFLSPHKTLKLFCFYGTKNDREGQIEGQEGEGKRQQNSLLEKRPLGGLRVASYGLGRDARRARPSAPAVVHNEVVVLRPLGGLACNRHGFDRRLGAAGLHLHVPRVCRRRHKGNVLPGALDELPLDVPPSVTRHREVEVALGAFRTPLKGSGGRGKGGGGTKLSSCTSAKYVEYVMFERIFDETILPAGNKGSCLVLPHTTHLSVTKALKLEGIGLLPEPFPLAVPSMHAPHISESPY